MTSYETTTTRLAGGPEPELCALVQDLLPLYLDGEVSATSRDLITDHLGRCERCAGFLAGAQSVRVQLRRDQLQRSASVQADAPQRGAVMRVRDVLASIAVLILCVPGGASAAAIGEGLDGSSPDALLVGLMMASIITACLLGLARVLGPLTNARLSTIMGGVALGGGGVILLMLFSSGSGSPFGVMAGFGLGLAGLIGVWSGVVRGGQLPLAQAELRAEG
jgi:hypothetical protein